MAKKPICGISSCSQPITSPRKEKKRADESAHCFFFRVRAHNVSHNKGRIIRPGKGIGTKSNTARTI